MERARRLMFKKVVNVTKLDSHSFSKDFSRHRYKSTHGDPPAKYSIKGVFIMTKS